MTAKKVSMAEILAAKNSQPEPVEVEEAPAEASTTGGGSGTLRPGRKPVGKRSHPDFERMCVYVPSKLRRAAERKWEDETGKDDVSELVMKLLQEYAGAQ